MGITYPYELANGNTADADEVMANFNEVKNNLDTDTVDDASANITAMQATADPYPGDTESLDTELRGEIKRLRYQFDAIIGKTNWYQDPDTNLLLEFNKGADIASANALALGTDGNYFDVTGTTAITSINTRRVGSIIKLHFDGILTLTHHVTDLMLPGAANITTAAGDEAEFVEYATGDWRCTNYSYAAGGFVTGGNTHGHDGGDGATISQGGLKTATGSISESIAPATTEEISSLLPGGSYGFLPKVKANETLKINFLGFSHDANQTNGSNVPTSYATITGVFQNVDGGLPYTGYLEQVYVQASPPYKVGNKKWGHFLYLLTNIATGEIKSAYEAEDPPYAYNGPSHNPKDSIERILAVPHPFKNYFDKDPSVDGLEIILIDLRDHDTKKWKADNAKKGKGILEDLGHINKKGKIVTPRELGISNIQGFTDKVKIRKHN